MLRKINVRCVFDEQTKSYAEFAGKTAKKLAAHPELLTFTQHTPTDKRRGSWGHGQGLVEALSYCGNVEDINVMADSDTVLLRRGWDDVVREVLRTHHCFGTTFMNMGGFGTVNTSKYTYKNTPTFTWIALGPRLPWNELDPRREPTDMLIQDEEQAKLYGLTMGQTLLRDVGWRLPKFLQDHKLSAAGLKRGRVVLKGLSEYNEEFHLMPGDPFVAHQRGSNKHKFRSEPHSKAFYECCERWLASRQ